MIKVGSTKIVQGPSDFPSNKIFFGILQFCSEVLTNSPPLAKLPSLISLSALITFPSVANLPTLLINLSSLTNIPLHKQRRTSSIYAIQSKSLRHSYLAIVSVIYKILPHVLLIRGVYIEQTPLLSECLFYNFYSQKQPFARKTPNLSSVMFDDLYSYLQPFSVGAHKK